MTTAEDKASLRKQILAARRQLSPAAVADGSQLITELLLSWPEFLQAKTVMGYFAMPDEPTLDEVLTAALDMGKKVCVPFLGSAYGHMDAAAFTGFDQLIAGRLGVRMPDPSTVCTVEPALIDLVLTPGVVFDLHGSRIGMGAGYYDRFLVRAPRALRMGIAWSIQLAAHLPHDEHDIPMHWLATEKGLFRCTG